MRQQFLLVAVLSVVVTGAAGCGSETDAEFFCGSGVVARAETCDDGNEASGDGCSDTCQIESGWYCRGQPSKCVRLVDECAEGTAACDANATCKDTPESFACTCKTGYTGDGMTCVDANECTAGSATCDVNATCTNTPGGFTCACKAGYTGNGTTCTKLNDVPTISPVANQRITAGSSTGDLAFTVGDTETAAGSLTVTATSSNTNLVPNAPSNLVLGGSGSSRTLNVIPVANTKGSTTITLSVSDGSATTSTTFTVDVTSLASLYWVTQAGSLWRVNVNGTNAMELKTGISGGGVVATDPVTRTLFYNRSSSIVRADSDGANPVDIVANGGNISGLAVDSTNRKLYWSDFNGSRVMRAELDGSNPTQIAGNLDSPSALALDLPRGKLYVITYNNTKLLRFNLDGTNPETLASNLGGQGVGLAVDSSGGKVYYSTRGNSVYVANLDGSNVTTLVTNQSSAWGIAIDVTAGRLYWADWLGGTIRSANLADGSDIQNVNSSSNRNYGLAWMPAP